MNQPPDAQAPGSEGSTIGQRLRDFAGGLVGHAFISGIHNLDGRGAREVEELTDLFEAKVLEFMLREKRLEVGRAPPRPEPSEVGEAWKLVPIEPTQDMARRFIATYTDQCFALAYRAMLAVSPLSPCCKGLAPASECRCEQDRLLASPPPTRPTPSVNEDDLMEIIDPGCTDMSDQFTNAASVKYFGEQARRQEISRHKAKQILALLVGTRPSPEDADEELIAELRSFGRAYPEDIFPPLSDEERAAIKPSTLSRISAEMGRHFAQFADKAADRLSSLSAKGETR